MTSAPSASCSCLIVDDDPAMRALLSVQLEMLGAEVKVTEDAEQALAQLEGGGEAFDVVVTDHRLPDQRRGIEVLERARVALPTAELFLLSAHIEAQTLDQAAEYGATVVDKVDLSPIVQRITSLMAG